MHTCIVGYINNDSLYSYHMYYNNNNNKYIYSGLQVYLSETVVVPPGPGNNMCRTHTGLVVTVDGSWETSSGLVVRRLR